MRGLLSLIATILLLFVCSRRAVSAEPGEYESLEIPGAQSIGTSPNFDRLSFDFAIEKNGKTHVVWVNNPNKPEQSGRQGLYYAAYDPALDQWSPAVHLTQDRNLPKPSITCANNSIHIVYLSRGACQLVSTDGGKNWEAMPTVPLGEKGAVGGIETMWLQNKLCLIYVAHHYHKMALEQHVQSMVEQADYKVISLANDGSNPVGTLIYTDPDYSGSGPDAHGRFTVARDGDTIALAILSVFRTKTPRGMNCEHRLVYVESNDAGQTWRPPLVYPITLGAYYQPGMRPLLMFGKDHATIFVGNKLLKIQRGENLAVNSADEFHPVFKIKAAFHGPDTQTDVIETAANSYQIFWCDNHLGKTALPHNAPDDSGEAGEETAFMPWLAITPITVTNDIFRCSVDGAKLRITKNERLTPEGLLNTAPMVKRLGDRLYLVWKGQRIINNRRGEPQLFFRILNGS